MRGRVRRRRQLAVQALEGRALLASFVITTVDDDGAGSLRRAILDANAAAGLDRITFAIAGLGVHTIRPESPLPAVTDPVVIDGATQPGYAGLPRIELDGSAAGGEARGLDIEAGGSTIRALAVNRFGATGAGIFLGGAGGNRVEGCFIGVTPDGRSAAGNGWIGLEIFGSPNNTIGGTTTDARNVIAASHAQDLSVIVDSGVGNVIQGNFIGLDAAGANYLGAVNTGGVLLSSPGALFGGASPGAGNVVAGVVAAGQGDTPVDRNLIVQGNLIGTDASGTRTLGLFGPGIDISSVRGVTIGGTAAGAGNVISGNGTGGAATGVMVFVASEVAIQGNWIGTDRTGTLELGNSGGGIHIGTQADHVTIGGTALRAGNVIAFNGFGPEPSGGSGVDVFLGQQVTILGNSIYGNRHLAIDLDSLGPTPNDPLDADSGPNGLLNVPTLDTARSLPDRLLVGGTYDGAPNLSVTLQFFASPTAGVNGRGDARVYLGSAEARTDGTGHAGIQAQLARLSSPGWFISATATDPDGDTSEASPSIQAVAGGVGTVSFQLAGYTVVEESGSVTIFVVRTGGGDPFDVSYATSDVSGPAPAAYLPASGVLHFGAGELAKAITVPLNNDTVPEPIRTFGLTLSAPTAGASLGPMPATTVSIVDNDPVAPTAVQVRRKRGAISTIVVALNGPIEAAGAAAKANYRLTTAGRDRKFGTKDDARIAVRSAAYDPATKTITLSPKGKVPFGRVLHLAIDGLRDPVGRPLDGDRDGQPGGTLLAILTRRGVSMARRT